MVGPFNPGCNCCTSCTRFSSGVGSVPFSGIPTNWYIWPVRLLTGTNACDALGAVGDSSIDTKLLLYESEDTDYWYFRRSGKADGIGFYGAIKKAASESSTYCEFLEATDENNADSLIVRWERNGAVAAPNNMDVVYVDASCNNQCPRITLNPGPTIGDFCPGTGAGVSGLMAVPRLLPETTASIGVTVSGVTGSSGCTDANGSFTLSLDAGTVWDGFFVASRWKSGVWTELQLGPLCSALVLPLCFTTCSGIRRDGARLNVGSSNYTGFYLRCPPASRSILTAIPASEWQRCGPDVGCSGGSVVSFSN